MVATKIEPIADDGLLASTEDDAAAALLKAAADEEVAKYLSERDGPSEAASEAQEPTPQYVSATGLFLHNFAEVYGTFSALTGMGKSIKAPTAAAVVQTAAQYAAQFTHVEIERQQRAQELALQQYMASLASPTTEEGVA
jgi:hypothetical protein